MNEKQEDVTGAMGKVEEDGVVSGLWKSESIVVHNSRTTSKQMVYYSLGIVLVLVAVLGRVSLLNHGDKPNFPRSARDLQWAKESDSGEDEFTAEEILRMAEQLRPKELMTVETGKKLAQHQLLHLHHMKTGGTSMDALIRCAINRLEDMNYSVPYSNLHECSDVMYKRCLSGEDKLCRDRMAASSVASFCAPLQDLPKFSWVPAPQTKSTIPTSEENPTKENQVSAITVLRHPVERVWSMYRFKTKFCYECHPLKQVYENIANGTYKEMCAFQLQNHMTRNLIQHEMTGSVDEKVKQAIQDMKSFFSIVGITEDLESTRIIAGKVFPWMAEKIEGSDRVCQLMELNKSPINNGCGPGGSHLELPPHPTPEDAELIIKHNQLDLAVYHEAQRQHRLQKLVLGM